MTLPQTLLQVTLTDAKYQYVSYERQIKHEESCQSLNGTMIMAMTWENSFILILESFSYFDSEYFEKGRTFISIYPYQCKGKGKVEKRTNKYFFSFLFFFLLFFSIAKPVYLVAKGILTTF
jgi:hypothetical protein